MEKEKVYFYSGVVVLLGAFSVLLYISYILFFPVKTLDVYNDPFPVEKAIVKRGDTQSYSVDFCRHTDAIATITRVIEGEAYASLGQIKSRFPAVCEKGRQVEPFLIPDFLPEGIYHIFITVEYDLNPLRKITKEYKTQEFKVIN